MDMKDVRLNNGVMMPAIGFGVYQIPVDETERIVSEVLEIPPLLGMLRCCYKSTGKCCLLPQNATDW